MTQSDEIYNYVRQFGRRGITRGELQDYFRMRIMNITGRISDCRAHGRPIECDKTVWPNRYYVPSEPEQMKLINAA